MANEKTTAGRAQAPARNGKASVAEADGTVRRGRRPDRAATEAALMEAALRLLERDGILAGINMQEVADEAGVNRGLIHHYFGSRQALLRAALDYRLQQAYVDYEKHRKAAPDVKGLRNFRGYVADPVLPRLILLLALDGDEALEPIPFAEQRIEDVERERDEGRFVEDLDIPALLVTWDATLYGYSLLRTTAAKQLGISVSRLDRRVASMLELQSRAYKLDGG